MNKITKTVAVASERWMTWNGVEAIGAGKTPTGKDCIEVFIRKDATETIQKLPKALDGIPVHIQYTDSIDAQH